MEGREGYRGWQVFRFDKPHLARYIRLHAVYNSKNTGFHVVEFEAYLHDEKIRINVRPADKAARKWLPVASRANASVATLGWLF